MKKIKLFGITIGSIEETEEKKLPFEDYDITNSQGITMHVNSMNKHLVGDFERGINPRCGRPLSQCVEGLGHVHL